MGPRMFLGDEMFWLFPLVMVLLFVGLAAARAFIFKGRGHHRSMKRGFGMKGGRMRRGRMTLDEEYSSQRSPEAAAPKDAEAEAVSSEIEAYLEQARVYQKQIDSMAASSSGQYRQPRLQEMVNQVDEWVNAIEILTKSVTRFEQNNLVQRDLAAVPQAIEKLEAQLALESNVSTRRELERTLANRRSQLAALEDLQETMQRAEMKIESTVSALGTIYSQLLTTQSTDQVADYSRLSGEIDEEVKTLQDHLEALREVKLDVA